jgi:hypothetical protein
LLHPVSARASAPDLLSFNTALEQEEESEAEGRGSDDEDSDEEVELPPVRDAMWGFWLFKRAPECAIYCQGCFSNVAQMKRRVPDKPPAKSEPKATAPRKQLQVVAANVRSLCAVVH